MHSDIGRTEFSVPDSEMAKQNLTDAVSLLRSTVGHHEAIEQLKSVLAGYFVEDSIDSLRAYPF